MRTNFQIEVKKSNGNLHVKPRGDFDGNSAWELVNLLHDQYDGQGRIFIDTHNLREICPFGCNTFQCRLNLNRIPPDRLFFKGENGFKIAPNGSKVLVSHQNHGCRCDGRCSECACKAKDQVMKNPGRIQDPGH